MITTQFHENFRSFSGNSVGEISHLIADFADKMQIAVKSFSLVQTGTLPAYIAVIGYRDDAESYPVNVQTALIGAYDPLGTDFDGRLHVAEDHVGGDVICHSLYFDGTAFRIAFLMHG